MPIIEIEKITGITSLTTYETSEMKECKLNKYNLITTKYGDFIPQYKDPGVRKKDIKSISFYKSGVIKSISLEEQTDVRTSIGIFPAELVSFFEDGSLHSIFPLNGQIGFSWSEKEEEELLQLLDFEFPFGCFQAKIIGLRFYRSGKIRSVILWPSEKITLATPAGIIPVRIGFQLYEDGTIESVEPEVPVCVQTPIGPVNAFDINALAVDADNNSLKFDSSGRVVKLVTSDRIAVSSKNNGICNNDVSNNNLTGERVLKPSYRMGLLEDNFVKMPFKIGFHGEYASIDNGVKEEEFIMSKWDFTIDNVDPIHKSCNGYCTDCTECM